MSTLRKMRLFHLASANLPIGSFAYSQGLEYAIEKGWVSNQDTFYIWQYNQIAHTLVYLDWPILKRLYLSCISDNKDNFHFWINFLLANRETSELRFEELQKGLSFLSLIYQWDVQLDETWSSLLKLSQLAGIAWVSKKWKLPLEDVLLAFGYSWLENSITVAMKLVPFGQKTAQNFLKEFCQLLSKRVKISILLQDNNIGSGIPLVAISSSCHETQYSRLFRS